MNSAMGVFFSLLSISVIPLLMPEIFGEQSTQHLGTVCQPLWTDTDTLIFRRPPDDNGINVELYCKRGFFKIGYNFVLEITRPDSMGGDSTVAGCFFPRGHNSHDLPRSSDGNIGKITWVNEDPDNPGDKYIFEYDPLEDMITITKTIDGETTVIGPRTAPKNFDELEDIIEDPQGLGCSYEITHRSLGFDQPVGNLTVTVKDSTTGQGAANVNVEIHDKSDGWTFKLPTNQDGKVTLELGSGSFDVSAMVEAFDTKIVSDTRTINMNDNVDLEFVLDTSPLLADGSLSNGRLVNVVLNKQDNKIMFTMNTSSIDDGKFDLVLPKTLLDSQLNGKDTPFKILIDGKQTSYTETSDLLVRKLSIPISAGSDKIEIASNTSDIDVVVLLSIGISIAIIGGTAIFFIARRR